MMKTVLAVTFGILLTGVTFGVTRWMVCGYADLGDIWLSLSGDFVYDFYRETWQGRVLGFFDLGMLCAGGLVVAISALKRMGLAYRLLTITGVNFAMLVAYVSLDAGAMRTVTWRHGAELAHTREWKTRAKQRNAQQGAAPLPSAPQVGPSDGAR